MEGLSTPATTVGEFADATLNHAVAAMGPGWRVSRGCVLDIDDGLFSARVQYALLHARVGIALLDVVPATTTLNAADRLRQRFDFMGFGAKFGRNPPILYFCVPLRAISDIGYLLEQEFGQQPSSALPSDDAWVTTAQDMLSAKPVESSGSEVHLAGTSDHVPRHHSRNLTSAVQGRGSGRLLGGARLLAGFWGLVTLSLGGGAMCLQYLGPPAERAYSTSVMEKRPASGTGMSPAPSPPPNQADTASDALSALTSLAKPDATHAVEDAGGEAPPPTADTKDSIDAELQRALVENDRAIIELRERLKTLEQPPGTNADASPPDTSPIASAALQGDSFTATAIKQQHDTDGSISRTPAETVATLPAQISSPITATAAPAAALVAPLLPLPSERPTAEDAPPETLVHSDMESQALPHPEEETTLPAPKDGAAANHDPPSSASAEAPAEPAEASPTVHPHEPEAVAAPSVANASPSSAPRSISPALANVMLRRAHALLQTGDVSAARLLYQPLAVAGSSRAATTMGKTYDAAFLLALGITGVVADPVLAATWYRRGLDLGDVEARFLLQALPIPAGSTSTAQEKPP